MSPQCRYSLLRTTSLWAVRWFFYFARESSRAMDCALKKKFNPELLLVLLAVILSETVIEILYDLFPWVFGDLIGETFKKSTHRGTLFFGFSDYLSAVALRLLCGCSAVALRLLCGCSAVALRF